MQESITLKQMADISGFSVSTVSKALNDKFDVSPSTKKKILELAKDFNYTPNSLAISLRRQKTYALAILVPDISNYQCASIVSEAQKLFFQNGFKLFVFQHFGNKKLEKECLSYLSKGNVDGAVLIVSDSNFNRSSCTISIPNVILNMKTYYKLNIKNKEQVENSLKMLINKISLYHIA